MEHGVECVAQCVEIHAAAQLVQEGNTGSGEVLVKRLERSISHRFARLPSTPQNTCDNSCSSTECEPQEKLGEGHWILTEGFS